MPKQNQASWTKYIPAIESAFNDLPNPNTGYPPTLLHTGKQPKEVIPGMPTPIQDQETSQAERVKMAYERITKRIAVRNKHRKRHKQTWNPAEGDLVLYKAHQKSSLLKKETNKMHLMWHGPAVIKRQLSDRSFELENPRTKKIIARYNLTLLRPYKTSVP